MRCFIGFRLSEESKENIFTAASPLKSEIKASFVPKENYHITVAFLGEISPKEAARVKKLLSEAKLKPYAGELRADGFGFFGRKEKAVLWAGLSDTEELCKRAEYIRNLLKKGGASFDEKPFKPHITIARNADISRYKDACSEISATVKIEGAALFESRSINGALKYIPLLCID